MAGEVINGKVVSRWFRRGKARIPIFEDGSIGTKNYVTQGQEDREKLKGETREQRQKWEHAFHYGHNREYYQGVRDKWDEKYKNAETAQQRLFAKGQYEAWDKNLVATAEREDTFNGIYDYPKEYKGDTSKLEGKHIASRETRAREIDNFNNDINPMEEWSDTVGDGYSDAQRKEIERFKERKGTKQEVSTREIPESVVRRLNQKGLKEMVNNGATDITRYSESDLKKLEKKHGRLEVVKRTMGTYGMNGGLFRSNKTGEYFVVTSRNGNLFYLA